jgi:hypothetical protein
MEYPECPKNIHTHKVNISYYNVYTSFWDTLYMFLCNESVDINTCFSYAYLCIFCTTYMSFIRIRRAVKFYRVVNVVFGATRHMYLCVRAGGCWGGVYIHTQ